jgi:hypothetical protein
VSYNVSNDNNSLFSAQPAINASGLLTFTPAANAFGTATVTVTAQDNGGTLNGGVDTSAAQTFTITVNAVNDEPSFTPGGNQTVNEDAGAQSVAWATAISAGPANESSQTVTFHTSNDNNALFSSQPSIASNGTLTYTPAANANGTATVTVYATDDGGIANGGDDTSATYTFTITVNAVNDAPSFTGGGNVTVNEDSGAYSAAWATAISAGPADESGQTLTFNIVSNSNPALFASGPSVSASGVLAFTPAANAFGSATIVINLQDNGGGSDTSSNYTFTITVNPVNDAPSFTSGGDVTVNEDSGPYSAAWASAISPGPNESGQLVNFVVTNSNNSLFSSQPSISPTGVLTFTPAPNASGSVTVSVTLHDNGGTANGGVDNSPTVQFTITINGVNDAPTASNDTWETLGNTEIRVDLAGGTTPKIVDTTASGNGVRDNDSDPEGDPFAVTGIVGCSDVTAPFDCTFGDGAKVSMNANGSFSYTPGPGNPIGSFQYQITDTPAAGSPATSIGTVTFTIYDRIWYVNGSAAPGGNGTSSAPFDSFASLSGGSDVDVPGDTIFIHNSLVSGSLAAEANQKIWGEGVGLSTNQNLNGNGTPQVLVAAGVRPQVSSSTDVITVTGVTGVDIAGISLSSATGAGVLVTSTLGFPAAGATIRENVVTSAGGAGIDVNADSALGTTVHVTNTSITSTGNGFDVNGSGPSVVSYNGGTILSASGNGIWLDGSGSGGNLTVTGLSNVTIDGTTAAQGIHADAVKFDATAGGSFDTVNGGTIVVGSAGNPVGTAGVSLTSVSGDFAIGSLTVFGGTSGVTVGGSGLFTGAAGMRITNGAGSISAPAGVGLSVTNATIGASGVKFTSISSNGAVNGIVLNNTGSSGSLTVQGTGSAASGGTIQNTSSHGVMLTSTLAPSFNNLSVQSTFGSGVKGTQVTGFSFTNGAINNSGTGLGVDESNIAFNTTAAGTENNLSGVVTITGNTLSTAYYHGVDIFNFNGTISNANISNNTITSTASTATSKGSGIRLIAFGSASTVANVTKAAITGNTVSNFPSAAGIMAQGGNGNAAGSPGTFGVAGSGINIISITGNFVAGASAANRLGTQAILAVVNGRGQGNFDISGNGTAGNPIRDMIGNAISLSSLGFANVTASVNNNVIAANNLLASAGIAAGTSRTFTGADTPSLTVSIVGNTVSQANGNGILVTARDATGTLHADVRNNIVAAPTSGIRPGIRADAGNALSIDDAMCLKISGNTSAGSGGSQGIGLRKQGAVTTTNDFGVDGMSATSSPGVESYVDSQNPAGNGTLLISATSGFSNCTF